MLKQVLKSDQRLRTNEQRDLKSLIVSITCVPLTWILFMGWKLGQTIMAGDAVNRTIPIRDLVESGGLWSNILYRPEVLGGVKIADILGVIPIYQFGGMIGLGPITTMNLGVFVAQIFISFLAIVSIHNLLNHWQIGKKKTFNLNVIHQIAIVWLTGFIPIVSWRIAYGHLNLVMGLLLFCVVLAFATSILKRQFSLTLIFIGIVALLHCYISNGHQTKVYSVVFGLPIIVGLIWPWVTSLKSKTQSIQFGLRPLIIALLILIGSLFLSLPQFSGMLKHVKSSDATRSLDGESVIYSYTTANIADWASSITWTKSTIPKDREQFKWHEVNYPMGPLLLLVILAFGSTYLSVKIGLLVSFIVATLFSMNLEPIASLLPTIIPPLNSFRVPARAIMPFCLSIAILGSCFLLQLFQEQTKTKKNQFDGIQLWIGAAIGAAIIFLIPSDLREILLWALVGMICFSGGRKIISFLPSSVILILIGAGSLGSFKQRLLEFHSEEVRINHNVKIGKTLKAQLPQLNSPLTRAHFDFKLPNYMASSAWSAEISSLNGYNNPTRRFLDLYTSLGGAKYNPTIVYFDMPPNHPSFRILQQLYNVCCLIQQKNKRPVLTKLPRTPGQFWLSSQKIITKGRKQLAQSLKENFNQLSVNLILNEGDSRFDDKIRNLDFNGCEATRIVSFRMEPKSQKIEFDADSPKSCPITISTNYTDLFVASSGSNKLPIFPSYGALTSVLLPPGKNHIVIEAQSHIPTWAWVLACLGALMILGSIFLSFKLDSFAPQTLVEESTIPQSKKKKTKKKR